MAEGLKKMIVAPVDGSENALKALDYLELMFGSRHLLKVTLLYVVPSLPLMLIEERSKSRDAAQKIQEVEDKNLQMAERVLSEAKSALMRKGFDEDRIATVYRKKQIGIAQDICTWAESKYADAIVFNTHGRSRLETFFMGETARKVLEHSQVCPVWLIKGTVRVKPVIIAVDGSENALRAVDHAGFILSGTDCPVTLFHSKRQLKGFVPLEALEGSPELEALWGRKTEQEIAPCMEKAGEELLKAGLTEPQISSKVVESTRSVAADILREAQRMGAGTIVMGRRGLTGIKEFVMGSVTRKVIEGCDDMAVWVVR